MTFTERGCVFPLPEKFFGKDGSKLTHPDDIYFVDADGKWVCIEGYRDVPEDQLGTPNTNTLAIDALYELAKAVMR